MVTIGPPLGPVMYVLPQFHIIPYGTNQGSVGYLVQLKGWRTAFQLIAAIHLALFVAHIFWGPETLFLEHDQNDEAVRPSSSKKRWRQYVQFGIFDPTPLKTVEFIQPFLMFARPVVLLPAIAYAFVFAYTNVLVVSGSYPCINYV